MGWKNPTPSSPIVLFITPNSGHCYSPTKDHSQLETGFLVQISANLPEIRARNPVSCPNLFYAIPPRKLGDRLSSINFLDQPQETSTQ